MIININISKIWVNRQLTCEKLDRITGELTISKINRINWINIGNVKNFLSHFRHETNLKTSHSLLSHQNILLRFLSYSVAYEYIIMLVSSSFVPPYWIFYQNPSSLDGALAHKGRYKKHYPPGIWIKSIYLATKRCNYLIFC